MNYDDFKDQFGMWAEKFKPFIESEDFFNIYQKIKHDAQTEIICPSSSDTFKVFELTNPNTIKVIIVLMDPYCRRYKDKKLQATGIPMDCSNSADGKLQPSLTKFYDAMSKEIGHKVEYSPSLKYLLEQGCLLLNSDLTVKLNKTQSHEGLWRPFMKYFFEEVLYGKSGIIYVLAGKSSQKLERFINPLGNHIIKIEHPAAAEYTSRDWNSEGIFTKINNILLADKGKEAWILWDKKEWDEVLPF